MAIERRSISFTTEELKLLEGLAKHNKLSLSNFIRKKIRLPKLSHGGQRENAGRKIQEPETAKPE